MSERSTWPLPSQSHRVRRLLYLTEGIVVGGGIIFGLLLLLDGISFLRDFEFPPRHISTETIGLVLFMVVLGLTGLLIVGVSWRESKRREAGTPYRDWVETRRWPVVLGIGIAFWGLVIGTLVWMWGWRSVSLDGGWSILTVLLLAGFWVYVYVANKVGFGKRSA